ncbi:unnamed protein product [Auanema sp. JU1783]|nr:unnamed protein product [Auanema sp. JU1783]
MNYFVKKRKMIHELEKTSDYQELVKRINKNDSGSNLYIQKESNLLSLNDYLSLQEMVPLSPALAAKWIKGMVVGDIDESRVMINEKGVAGILLPPSLYIAPSKDKYSYFLIDTEPIGKMLHRFMSGSSHIPKLKNHSYIVVPELENGLRLATVLLSNSEDVRLSLAAIINHPWIQKHAERSKKQLILID